ncbi:MAG: DUF1223 domain-containing protein [Cyclobacteriaceae bacterium]
MKYSVSLLAILSIVFGLTFLLAGGTEVPSSPTAPSAQSGIAVIELFTSQGCSSCPPADQLLQSLVRQAEEEDRPIYALSFHVDYWNRLGWEDPFSDPAFSARQRQYAHTWKNAQVYTPQMVVNGRRGFVGSKQAQAQDAIQAALATDAAASVVVQLSTEKDVLNVAYEVHSSKHQSQLLQLAVVEEAVATPVRRGENAGRTLQHTHVVRHFITQPLDESLKGQIRIKLAPDLPREKAQLIAYVQEAASLEIIGAMAKPLPSELP